MKKDKEKRGAKMSLSKKIALDTMYNSESLRLHDVGFITTVIRDNEVDDDMYNYYNLILKVIDDFDSLLSYVNEHEI